MEYRIAGVVVLYNPEFNCIKNINSYVNQIDSLFVIDNSEVQNSQIVDEFIKNTRIKYIFNNQNLGIATALNLGAKFALKDDFDYLLTMDQDTFVDQNLIQNYRNFLLNTDNKNIGVLAPIPIYYPNEKNVQLQNSLEKDVVITSGSLLNLKVLQEVGFFKDDLFIDYVDFEYCLRLRKKKYKVLQLGSAKVYHRLGNLEKHKILFKNINVTHHSSLRYYYRTRNRFYVIRKYLTTHPIFTLKDIIVFTNEILKVIFYEKDKFIKIKMILIGLKDFVKNKYGKFDTMGS